MLNLFKKKPKTVGERIAEERKKKGYTQSQLADILKVSDKAVSKWEAGGGDPSFEMLAPLSEALGVSIDYLVTGKEAKEAPKKNSEDEGLSPIEKCAKLDDPKLAEGLSLNEKDGKGHNLAHYMSKYGSGKVFVYLLGKIEFSGKGGWPFSRSDVLRFILIANRIDLLDKFHIYTIEDGLDFSKKEDLFLLGPLVRGTNIPASEYYRTGIPILEESYFETVISDTHLNKETRDFALGLTLKNRPCHHYPSLIHMAYKKEDWETFDLLMDEAEKNNTARKYIQRSNDYYIPGGRSVNVEGAVIIERKTLHEALARKDYERLERFQIINKDVKERLRESAPLVDEYDIKMTKLKDDKSISDSDILIEKSIRDSKNPILDLSVLLEEVDIPTIEKAFEKYAIYEGELRYKRLKPLGEAIEKGDWRFILHFYVDNEYGYYKPFEDEKVPYWVRAMDINRGKEEYKKLLKNPYGGRGYYDHRIDPNEKVIEDLFKKNNPTVNRSQKLRMERRNWNYDDIARYAEEDKAAVLEVLRHKGKMNASTAVLTKEYFEAELAKGNEEIVIIKLCKLLETILKEKYLYEGDLSEMLDKYCIDQKVYPAISERLNALRKQRNALVHPEATDRSLGRDELKECIEYVTAMK